MITVSLNGTVRRFEGAEARALADAFIKGAREPQRPKPPKPEKGHVPRRAIEAAARAAAARRDAFQQAVLAHLAKRPGAICTVSDIAELFDVSDKHAGRLMGKMCRAGLVIATRKGFGGKRWFSLPEGEGEQ